MYHDSLYNFRNFTKPRVVKAYVPHFPVHRMQVLLEDSSKIAVRLITGNLQRKGKYPNHGQQASTSMDSYSENYIGQGGNRHKLRVSQYI
jgi:hypothetical protein